MNYLLDTNVISELRKGDRCQANVRSWFAAQDNVTLFTSVLVIGEIRRGIESLRRRDPVAAGKLDRWLTALVSDFEQRILSVDQAVAELWGRLGVGRPLPVIDGLLAATAKHHGFTLVTRNIQDIAHLDVLWLNPFEGDRT